MEQMKAALVGIDAVIDETYGWGDSYALNTFMAGFNFTAADVASGDYPFLSSMTLRHDALKVNHEESGSWGTAWFEDAIVRADMVLDDIASYLHPSLLPSHSSRFFRDIAVGETITLATAADCTDPHAVCPGETAPPSPPVQTNYCMFGFCLLAAPPPPPAAGFQNQLDANGCLINFDPAVDYFPPELRAMVAEGGTMPTTVTFATDFSIDYHHTFKVLRNLKNGKVYVLHQCGAGDISTIAADLPADAVDAPVFEVPVQSWSTGSTVPIAFMELLGLIGKAALIDPQYASSACTQKLHQCGVIDTVVPGWPHTMYSAFANASRASGSTVHWTDDWGTGQAFSDIDVAFDSTSDPGALARVEWIKFVAAFFNLEPHANRIFAEIKAEYDQTEAAAAAALAAGTVAPKVLWISAASAWGPATISTVSYKMDLDKWTDVNCAFPILFALFCFCCLCNKLARH